MTVGLPAVPSQTDPRALKVESSHSVRPPSLSSFLLSLPWASPGLRLASWSIRLTDSVKTTKCKPTVCVIIYSHL